MSKAKLRGLDTSVVLRLLTGEPESQAKAALAALDAIVAPGGKAAVSDLVLSETYYALQFHYGVPKAKALTSLKEFVDSDEIHCLGVAAELLRKQGLAQASPGFVDQLIHGEYIQHCGKMLSFEKAAKKLPGASVIK